MHDDGVSFLRAFAIALGQCDVLQTTLGGDDAFFFAVFSEEGFSDF
jgi:hypothetical protein